MTAAERLALIRARVRPITNSQPKPVGVFAATQGVTRARIRSVKHAPAKPYAGKAGWLDYELVSGEHRRKKWVQEPDEGCRNGFKDRPRKRAHHLTRIAERLKRGWH